MIWKNYQESSIKHDTNERRFSFKSMHDVYQKIREELQPKCVIESLGTGINEG